MEKKFFEVVSLAVTKDYKVTMMHFDLGFDSYEEAQSCALKMRGISKLSNDQERDTHRQVTLPFVINQRDVLLLFSMYNSLNENPENLAVVLNNIP